MPNSNSTLGYGFQGQHLNLNESLPQGPVLNAYSANTIETKSKKDDIALAVQHEVLLKMEAALSYETSPSKVLSKSAIQETNHSNNSKTLLSSGHSSSVQQIIIK